jgi:hypothetical protein
MFSRLVKNDPYSQNFLIYKLHANMGLSQVRGCIIIIGLC